MRELVTATRILAASLVAMVTQAVGELEPAKIPSTRDVAVFDAPIGHRQPGLADLPPWLREQEESGSGHSGQTRDELGPNDVQERRPKLEEPTPPYGTPQICQLC